MAMGSSRCGALLRREVLRPGVVELRMCAPRGNTFDIALVREFTATIRELESDGTTNAVALTSGIPGIYCAGLDLTMFVDPVPSELRAYWGAFEEMWRTWYTTPLATGASVNGACPALGAILALSADTRLMRDDARSTIGLNETALAMVPPLWLQALLARTIGHRNSERHLQCATMFSVGEAHAVGLVDSIVPASVSNAELLDATVVALEPYLAIPRNARSATKQNQRSACAALADVHSIDRIVECITGDVFQESVARVMSELKLASAAKKAAAAAADVPT